MSETVEVIPDDRLFEELGKNNYDFHDLLSELIDNSIAAKNERLPVQVDIFFHMGEDGKPKRFVIKDNAKGIAAKDLGVALSPAAKRTHGSLNEHGLGMKQAIASLGKLDYLATKVRGEKNSRVIKKIGWGKLPIVHDKKLLSEYDSGTELSVVDLKALVVFDKGSITRNLASELGARYRRYLSGQVKRLELNILLINERGEVDRKWEIRAVKPVYFHPHTRENRPVVLNFPLGGKEWKAKLTFGYAPKENEEYEELQLEPPSKHNPYFVSLSKQGLDIIMQDRVVLPHQLAELKIVEAAHPSLNYIRGEIDLIEGFSTAITKNSVISDKNFQECIKEITEILTGQRLGPDKEPRDYLKGQSYSGQLPEKALRDRLAELLRRPPYNKRDIFTEYDVGDIEGFIDVLADSEAWELKVEFAKALDVYQLFMYMDIGGYDSGHLVAQGFSTGAKVAANKIKSKHRKNIELIERKNLAINQPLSNEERAFYL